MYFDCLIYLYYLKILNINHTILTLTLTQSVIVKPNWTLKSTDSRWKCRRPRRSRRRRQRRSRRRSRWWYITLTYWLVGLLDRWLVGLMVCWVESWLALMLTHLSETFTSKSISYLTSRLTSIIPQLNITLILPQYYLNINPSLLD